MPSNKQIKDGYKNAFCTIEKIRFLNKKHLLNTEEDWAEIGRASYNQVMEFLASNTRLVKD